jgi:hypothetical protein
LVLQGILDLAVADEEIKKNPAKSPVVQAPVFQALVIQIWADDVACLIDAHPDSLRALPELAASCGMREGELFGISLEDFDFDEKIVRVRRQVKRLDSIYVFAFPKNDRERIIPLSDWDIQAVRRHVEKYPPRPYTLPWEKPGGKPHTASILFRWPTDGQHVKARSYSETIWKPALVKAGVIAEPAKDGRAAAATSPPAGKASTSSVITTPVSCSPGASPSRSSLNTLATATRPSRCASTPICCRALTTALARSSASVSPE